MFPRTSLQRLPLQPGKPNDCVKSLVPILHGLDVQYHAVCARKLSCSRAIMVSLETVEPWSFLISTNSKMIDSTSLS
jgi:hypothetical protein